MESTSSRPISPPRPARPPRSASPNRSRFQSFPPPTSSPSPSPPPPRPSSPTLSISLRPTEKKPPPPRPISPPPSLQDSLAPSQSPKTLRQHSRTPSPQPLPPTPNASRPSSPLPPLPLTPNSRPSGRPSSPLPPIPAQGRSSPGSPLPPSSSSSSPQNPPSPPPPYTKKASSPSTPFPSPPTTHSQNAQQSEPLPFFIPASVNTNTPQKLEEQPFTFHGSRLSRSSTIGVWASVSGEGEGGRGGRGTKRVGSSIGGRRGRNSEMGWEKTEEGVVNMTSPHSVCHRSPSPPPSSSSSSSSSSPFSPSSPPSTSSPLSSSNSSPCPTSPSLLSPKTGGGKKKNQLKLFSKKEPKSKAGVFGRPIEELQVEGLIPLVMLHCIKYLTRTPERLKTEGLFRVSSNYRELEELKKQYSNPSVQVDLEQTKNVHNVCGLLKAWFSQLPDPLFPFDVYQPMIDVFSSTEDKSFLINFFRKVLNNLPEDRKCIILMLFEYFNCVLKFQAENKMSPSNLSIVFGPSLLRPLVTDALSLMSKEPNLIIEFMIENYEAILTDENPIQPALPPSPPPSPPPT